MIGGSRDQEQLFYSFSLDEAAAGRSLGPRDRPPALLICHGSMVERPTHSLLAPAGPRSIRR